MNIVLIIADTLRRDHLGCYGARDVRTPQLDRFAEQCMIFDRAYCASFPTMPTRADILTGKFTFNYLGWAPLPREEVILPQVLSQAGYRTMAVVDTPFYVKNGYGYDRGFHDFRWIRGQSSDRADTNYERRYEEDYCAPMTMMAAERWLERHYKEAFFLYVDTWDPHEPWDPPAHYVESYLPRWDGTLVAPVYWDYRERGLTQRQMRIARACYAGEVTMVDRWTGRLIERLESLGLMEDTAIMFTTDHGFYFGEHGFFGKAMMQKGDFYGAPLYEEITRVPLLAYVPGYKARRVGGLVSLPDLMPTILELAGARIPDTVQGRSLVPLMRGETNRGRGFAVSTMPLYNPGDVTRVVDAFERRVHAYLPATITTPTWSMLYSREGQPAELYNLKSDLRQQRNLAKRNRRVVQKLHRHYARMLAELGTEEKLLAPRQRL